MSPMISVNISCYNRAQMLRECLESFIAQTFEFFEVIVVDDGSEEDLTFVTAMDPRIKYFRQEHGGMAKGLNLAMEKSSGQYLMPFGSDDLALPDLLRDTFALIGVNPKIDVVYTDCWILRGDGTRIRKKHFEVKDPKEAYKEMLKCQYISHGGTLWNRNCLPHYDETVAPAEDWELFLKAMENGVRFKHLAKRLWVYRNAGQPRMSDDPRMAEQCDVVLKRRGYTFDKKTRRGTKCS